MRFILGLFEGCSLPGRFKTLWRESRWEHLLILVSYLAGCCCCSCRQDIFFGLCCFVCGAHCIVFAHFPYAAACSSQPAGADADCRVLESTISVWDSNGSLSDKDAIESIREIFGLLANIINSLGGVITIRDIKKKDITITKVENNNNTANDKAVSAGGYVGIVAGGLAMMLLLILLVRRRNGEDEVSHLKLEEDGDPTFIRELETTGSSPSREYNTRKTHVVGETDSIFSGWTGYSKEGGSGDDDSILGPYGGPTGRLGRQHGDVHVCSSATCEVCEKRRQEGLAFVPTSSPPRPQVLPLDASREYLADDTVEL
jgi:hypothetical protein